MQTWTENEIKELILYAKSLQQEVDECKIRKRRSKEQKIK